MSKEELIEGLNEIAENSFDEECDHIEADELLLHFINDEDVKKAFDAIKKWYA